ncbi:hydroxyethylthiazole kinase [Brachybacterium sp. ACRRE]|uniref:hydroxyethylthiazole kinase n=1 Tax=Brachybacterium sp. ACRRE TaxID=2918184 RepID=UPI00351D6D4B
MAPATPADGVPEVAADPSARPASRVGPVDPAGLAARCGELLDAVRERGPLVHAITNSVVTNVTANVVLAIGAAPAMVDIVGEAGDFAAVADGLLVNLGTPAPEQREAMHEAVAGARRVGTPWVLDPVAIGSLRVRTPLAAELVAQGPTAVRGNASEILALAGEGTGGRGVDSSDPIDAAVAAATRLARTHGAVVAVSGERDLITDGSTLVEVGGGSALLTRMTGGGCALGAVIAAFLGVRGEGAPALEAVVAAHAAYSAAAERAASGADGPGTFAPRLLDALAAIGPDELRAPGRLHVGAATPGGTGDHGDTVDQGDGGEAA